MSLVPASAARAAAGCQGPAPCVVVHVVDGTTPVSTHEFTADDISGDSTSLNGGSWQFQLRNDQGHLLPGGQSTQTALSIGHLLELAGVNLGGVDYATVATDDPQQPSVLSGADLPPGVPGRLVPAVFVQNAQLFYVRALRSSTDVNSSELVFTGTGAIVVTAYLHKPPLVVGLSAPSTTLHAGEPVTFTATASRQGAPVVGGVDYSWDFGGALATTRNGARQVSKTHTFSAGGTYLVAVNARNPGSNTYGRSAVLAIQVGPPPKPTHHPHHHGHGHHHHGHHPPTGPNGGNGHHPNGDPNGSNHTHHSGHGHQNGDSTHQSGTSHGHQQGSPQQPTHHGPTRHQHAPSIQGGVTVAGQLLDGAQVFEAPDKSTSVPKIEAAQARSVDHWSVPWKLAAGLVVPLLIGLGMAGESLQLRRRVARMSA